MNKKSTLEEVSAPLIEYLNNNYHPHVTAIVTTTSVEILEGKECVKTDKYLKD